MNADYFISILLLRLYQMMATQNYLDKFLHPDLDPRGSLGSYWTLFDYWLLPIILDPPEERDGLIICAA